jgi:HPt (histidine-containing phosphotransfer) domain-containing protein
LRNDMGTDGFDEVVELFLEEMDDRIASMKLGPMSNRSEDLHFLKGCAANVGFSGLLEICTQAEADDTLSLDQIWRCYDSEKEEFLANPKIHYTQISTPESTSSSVMSR